MKIHDRTTRTHGQPPSHPAAPSKAAADAGTAAIGPQRIAKAGSPDDVATLLGIPTAEMTPAIRQGLARLIEDVVRLLNEIDGKNRRIAYLEKLADEDPHMPVLNRRAFVRELSRSMAVAERYGIISSVLYIDVNGMKRINDSHGHGAGDAALSHIAETLVAHVRKSDVVGRLGGDEFGVILVPADENQAVAKGHSLARLIAGTPFLWDKQQLYVDVSFGATVLSGSLRTPDEALAYADRLMYEDKRARENADKP